MADKEREIRNIGMPFKCPKCNGYEGMFKIRVHRHESDGSESLKVILICGECGYRYYFPRIFFPYTDGCRLAGYDEYRPLYPISEYR